MSFFDRARRFLGLDPSDDDDGGGEGAPSPGRGAADPRLAGRLADRRKGERPPLVDPPAGQGQGVEDVLAARDAGDHDGARRILRDIDRGGGLRTVLRAAAALEAGDDAEVRELLPAVAREEPRWRLLLQAGAAQGDAAPAARLIDLAEREGAPPWALAWSRAMSPDGGARRRGLVDLLFTDAPLARTVAARDLDLPGAASDVSAAQRYAAFAHGRDSIRRFGAPVVADLLERAGFGGGPPSATAAGRAHPGAR